MNASLISKIVFIFNIVIIIIKIITKMTLWQRNAAGVA